MNSPGRSNKLHHGGTRRLVSIPDARAELGDIGHTNHDLINRRELVKVNIGRRSFITAESITAYVDSLSETATA